MTDPDRRRVMVRLAALVAVLFGLVTIAAGGRVLLGGDPGYLVFRPLVVFNSVMGAVYVAAGILLWREAPAGRRLAAAIALVNALVLAGVVALRTGGGPVARESVAAMTVRTGVWAAIWALLAWPRRRRAA